MKDRVTRKALMEDYDLHGPKRNYNCPGFHPCAGKTECKKQSGLQRVNKDFRHCYKKFCNEPAIINKTLSGLKFYHLVFIDTALNHHDYRPVQH